MRKIVSALLSLMLLLSLAASASASPFLAPAGPQSVAINLIAADGTPIKQAEIHLLSPGIATVTTARTDERGQATLPLPAGYSFWIRVWADGYALIERPYVPANDGPSLTLQAAPYAVLLTGIIKDDRGMPVPQAQVSLFRAGYGLEGRAMTNSQGLYSLRIQGDGSYSLQVEAKGFRPVAQAVGGLSANSRNQVDLSLTRSAGYVTGEVVSSKNSSPVPGMIVELLAADWGVVGQTTTDNLGYFYLDAPPSNNPYQVRLSRPDYETYTTQNFTIGTGGWVDFSGSNRIAANPLYAQVSGRAVNPSDKPLKRVEVHLQRLDLGTIETAITDDDGRYKFIQVPAGTYRVRLFPNGDEVRTDSGWLTVAGGQDVTANLGATNPNKSSYGFESIEGTVKNHLGEPIKNATVTVHRGIETVTAQTNEDGRYFAEVKANISTKPADERGTGYHVQASAPGYLTNDQPTRNGGTPVSLVDAVQDADNQANFTLQPQYTSLAGRVMNTQGKPLEGVKVALRQEGRNQPIEMTTDRAGRYQFNNLPVAKQGQYLPVIADPNYVAGAINPNGAIASPTALNPANPSTFTLRARPATELLHGLIQAGDDRPAEGAQVIVARTADGSTYSAKVNADGSYQVQVPALPGDQYLVRAALEGSATNADPTVIDPGNSYGTQVNLTLHPNATITGRVFGPNGEPISGAKVLLFAEGSTLAIKSALTDNTGRYSLKDLAPGRRYSVLVADGENRLSGLTPGEPMVSPLIALPSGEVQWADIRVDVINR